MKKIVYIFLSVILFSCNKLPVNGKLDGMWQLMEIRYGNGLTIFPEKTYYNFQLELVKLSKIHPGSLHGSKTDYYVGRFEFTEDSLSFYNMRNARNENIVATDEDLAPYGLNVSIERFGVDELTRNNMILRSDRVVLSFRKF